MLPGRPKPKPAGFSPSTSRRSSRTGARCSERAAPAQCAAVVKADGYGCGVEQVAGALATGRLRDVLRRDDRRGAARARAAAPDAAIYVLNGLLPGTRAGLRRREPASGDRQRRRARRVDRVSRRVGMARRRGAAHRHRHEPARICLRRSRRARAPPAAGSRHRAGDEPLRLLGRGASAQRDPDRALRRRARELSRHRRIAREFLRHLPRRERASRPGAPRRRALRRQPDAGQAEPDARGRDAARPHRADARRRARRNRRLQRDLDRAGARRGLPSCRSAMRTASCAPQARATRGPAPRRSSRDSAVPSPAASRWT